MRRQEGKLNIGWFTLACCLVSTSAFGQLEVPQLSVAEMVERSSEQLKEMDSVIQAAFDSLEQARNDEDLQRISCINDALTAMKGLLKLAEENMLSLRETAARSDRESAEFEHMKISIPVINLWSSMRRSGAAVDLPWTGALMADLL